jgi:hypothetical protein
MVEVSLNNIFKNTCLDPNTIIILDTIIVLDTIIKDIVLIVKFTSFIQWK